MRGRNIIFKGINRQVGSPDNDDGYCSELINIKPQNVLKIVGSKTVKSAEIPYSDIRIHKTGDGINYIGIKRDAFNVSVIHFDHETGLSVQTIKEFDATSDISFVTFNNQIVISDKTSIKTFVYKFDGTYKLYFDGFDINFEHSLSSKSSAEYIEKYISCHSKEEFLSECNATYNKYEVESEKYCIGNFLYAFTLTLEDENEYGMYNLSFDGSGEGVKGRNVLFDISDNSSSAPLSSLKTKFKFINYYYQYTLAIKENLQMFERYKDIIKSVNLYVSLPLSPYQINSSYATFDNLEFNQDESNVKVTGTPSVILEPVKVKDSGIEGALLYKQKTWSLKEFCNGQEYVLTFGGDKQTTGATMEVSASFIERAGRMMIYNNKAHFFNTNVRTKVVNIGELFFKPNIDNNGGVDDDFDDGVSDDPTIIQPAPGKEFDNLVGAPITVDTYVFINVNGKKDCVLKYPQMDARAIRHSEDEEVEYLHLNGSMIVYPDSRAYRMLFIDNDNQRYCECSMVPSSSYDFAYYFTERPREGSWIDGIAFKPIDIEIPTTNDTYKETNAINVTANGSAIVFPVSYSYKFDGNITALAVEMQQISDSQVGQYPLVVFTDNGIYALEQGNGAILYSNILPLIGDSCTNPSVCYTSQGTAYIANGAVYLLNGRNSTKLSLLLEGQPDTYIQNNQSFLKCCGGSLYDITPYLCIVDFKEYVNEAKLSWCANTNELIVSNPAYPYSYVYDFVYNVWYKVSGVYEVIEDNLVLKPISLNDGNEAPASAKVTLSALHVEQTKQISVLSKATYPTTVSCGAGHNIALVIDGTQVASAVFSQITYAPMMVAVLCESIGYLEDYNGTIYSKTDLTGKTVRLYNISTGADIFSNTFTATSQAVEIPDKAIGTKVTLTIGNTAYNEVFLSSSSAITMLNNLADKVNANDPNVFATVQGNTIILTARVAGSAGNNINVSVAASDSNYLYISTTAMTGGQDISLQPSAYKEIIDWSLDEKSSTQTLHLHTRPMYIDNPHGYKTIRRAVLNCLAQIRGEQNLSVYIYASDNLIDWKCVAASQRKDCEIAQITLDRIAKSYKYFVFMIGGKVDNNTQMGHIALAVEDVVNKKLR